MDELQRVRYLTDDRDEDELKELLIEYGSNGDWYVSVVDEGAEGAGHSVRICTSGGAASKAPGLGISFATAFRILAGTQVGQVRSMPIDPAWDIEEVRYPTDDRDGMFRENELVMTRGRNGDWYVGVARKGKRPFNNTVRISTSGGAAARFPGLTVAIANAFWSLAQAKHEGRI